MGITKLTKSFVIAQGTLLCNQLILEHFGNVKIDHLHSFLWRSEMEYTNALHMHDATILCKILLKFGPVVLVENKIIDGNCCVVCSRRGSAYFVKYLRMYWTDFCNLLTIWKRFMCR